MREINSIAARPAAFRIIAVYVLFSSLWIFVSDIAVKRIVTNPDAMTSMEICKGLLFVLVTAAILYKLIRTYTGQVAGTNLQLQMTEFSIDSIPEAVYWISAEGRFLKVNAAACGMLGYSREELLLLSVPDIDPEHIRENGKANLEKLRRTGLLQLKRFHMTRDGRAIPVEITAKYLKNDDQEIICSVVRDLTEQVRKEKEVSFFKTLIEYTRDPVYVLDWKDGCRMTYANQAACSHFGMEREQLLTMRIPDWDPVFDIENMDEINRQLKQGKPMRFETLHCIASGKLVPVEVTANYLEYDGKELTVGYFFDISERKAMETALKESENRFRTLFQEFQALLDGLPDGITLLAPDLTVSWANSASANIINMRPSMLLGRHCYELRHGIDSPCENCPVRASFESGQQEIRILQAKPDRTVELRAIPVIDDSGKVLKVIEVARDITEQKNTEQQLHHSQKMEAVGQLAGGISHDFNNILTAILGFTSLMLMKMSSDDPLRHYAEQVQASAEKAADLTQGLLAFSRKQVITPHPADLNELLETTRKLLLSLLRDDIEFVVGPCPEPLMVMADSVRLEQVFMNLVSNARDAMPDGGKLIIGTERFDMDDTFVHAHGYGKAGTYACISVSDTGMGMEKQTREKIFEPFFTTKVVGKGTGLGLATAYGIIKQHEGYINVYSEPGQGTTFRIYLPLTSQALVKTESPGAVPVGCGETVLLADDDESVRKSNREILETFGYKVVEAIDGEDALEKYAGYEDLIDMLILDVIMPKKSGREVYNIVKKIRADIKVLFMSGYAADIVTRKRIHDERLNFIEKPVSPPELLTKIKEVLNS